MKYLGYLAVWLGVISFLDLFFVFYVGYSGSFIEKLNSFAKEFDGVLASVGTLLLVSGLALLTTYLANQSSERRERSNRRVQAELKVSEFRQAWISEMRADLSKYGAAVMIGYGDEEVRDLLALKSKIILRLNLDEPLASDIHGLLTQLIDEKNESVDKRTTTYNRYLKSCNDYLKGEWRRLKADLKAARLLEDKDDLR